MRRERNNEGADPKVVQRGELKDKDKEAWQRPDSIVVGGERGSKWASSNRGKTKNNTNMDTKTRTNTETTTKTKRLGSGLIALLLGVIGVKNGHPERRQRQIQTHR